MEVKELYETILPPQSIICTDNWSRPSDIITLECIYQKINEYKSSRIKCPVFPFYSCKFMDIVDS